jgi:hypothetical protein
MGCLIVLLGAFAPRIALLLVWIFSSRVSIAFHHVFIWPFLGLIFLPFTTLIYVFAYQPGVGVTGWGWLFVVLGVILDLASYGGSGYTNRDRMPGTA